MMKRLFARLTVGTAVVMVSSVLGALPASAQPGSGASQTVSASATKAQQKEVRKQARARKNAELKKLEENGYNPAARSDLNYPENLQNAQKKAGSASPASL